MKGQLGRDLNLIFRFFMLTYASDFSLACVFAAEYAAGLIAGEEREAAIRHLSRTYNVRASHVAPHASMWSALKASGSDTALLHYLRTPRAVLAELVAAVPASVGAWFDGFTDDTRTQRRPGPRTQLDVTDHIALALAWSSSQLNQKVRG